MIRRRMMMAASRQHNQNVLQWDYTMGMPEDNGFEKTAKGTVILNMTDDGLSINVYDALEQFVQYALPSNLRYCNEGILETKVIFSAFGSFTEGHRLQLSDGEQGFSVKCKHFIARSGFWCNP